MQFVLTWSEFLKLIGTDLLLLGAGILIFRPWTRQGQSPPVWLVFAMCIGVLAFYLMMTRHLWVQADGTDLVTAALGEIGPDGQRVVAQTSPLDEVRTADKIVVREGGDSRVLTVLIWCLLFWTIPVAYYTQKLLRAIEARGIERVTWLQVEVPDTEAFLDAEGFQEAQELALLGDVQGAVSKSGSFSRKRIQGCFAAARLLEADGRYKEAVDLYKELRRQLSGDKRIWAEATYRLAALHEDRLHNDTEAVLYYNELVLKARDTEHGEMASKAFKRLRPEGDALLEMLERNFDGNGPSVSDAPGTVSPLEPLQDRRIEASEFSRRESAG